MTPTGRGGPGGEALPSSLRGAALVGLAVIVGIIGLQILDDSGGTSSKALSSSPTSTTGAQVPAPHPPAQVKVKVYNASGVQNAGQSLSDKLKAQGWSTLEVLNYGSTQKGTVVDCRPGYEGDAVVIATYGVGNGAKIGTFPASPPTGSQDANCIVILGTA